MPAIIVRESWLRMKYSKNIVTACDHARTRCNPGFLENLGGRARINGVLAASIAFQNHGNEATLMPCRKLSASRKTFASSNRIL
jgi:hypothetical protein